MPRPVHFRRLWGLSSPPPQAQTGWRWFCAAAFPHQPSKGFPLLAMGRQWLPLFGLGIWLFFQFPCRNLSRPNLNGRRVFWIVLESCYLFSNFNQDFYLAHSPLYFRNCNGQRLVYFLDWFGRVLDYPARLCLCCCVDCHCFGGVGRWRHLIGFSILSWLLALYQFPVLSWTYAIASFPSS